MEELTWNSLSKEIESVTNSQFELYESNADDICPDYEECNE